MQIDFIKIPYTTSPSMIKNTGAIFSSTPNQDIIKQKKVEIKKYGTDLHGQIESLKPQIEQAAKYCNVFSDNIVDLALRLEEDVAIMHQGSLAAICFCFPSGFIPSSRIGQTLSQIHKPVADGELLVRSSPGIARVMTEQDSFKRHVWTITNNPDLSNHPNNKKSIVPNKIEDLYFRYEIQTTAKVNKETSLFFVKVNVLPLKDVYTEKILESINSMSPAILEYKNLTYIKNLLNLLKTDK